MAPNFVNSPASFGDIAARGRTESCTVAGGGLRGNDERRPTNPLNCRCAVKRFPQRRASRIRGSDRAWRGGCNRIARNSRHAFSAVIAWTWGSWRMAIPSLNITPGKSKNSSGWLT